MGDHNDCEVMAGDCAHDFVVGVYLYDLDPFSFGADKPRFLLSAEPDVGYEGVDCYRFVSNDAFQPPTTFYCPPMCMWAAPHTEPKSRRCSAIDSGTRPGRKQYIGDLATEIGEVELYGRGFGAPVGYDMDAKSACLAQYGFSIGVEHTECSDYLTEKITDITVNEGVAIYRGARRITDYYLPEAFVAAEDLGTIDWNDWDVEYERRRAGVLRQKEVIRTRFNVFRYFDIITGDMSLLGRKRRITLDWP